MGNVLKSAAGIDQVLERLAKLEADNKELSEKISSLEHVLSQQNVLLQRTLLEESARILAAQKGE